LHHAYIKKRGNNYPVNNQGIIVSYIPTSMVRKCL
jgi:hypothetical protein